MKEVNKPRKACGPKVLQNPDQGSTSGNDNTGFNSVHLNVPWILLVNQITILFFFLGTDS